MPKLYSCYIQLIKRRVIAERDVPLARACEFMVNTPGAVVASEGNFYTTIKELKDAQSIRPTAGIEFDSPTPSGESFPEGSYRQLLGTLGDNSE